MANRLIGLGRSFKRESDQANYALTILSAVAIVVTQSSRRIASCASPALNSTHFKMEGWAMAKGLDGRSRDKGGQIDKKHGNTLVKTLRKTYGDHFAAGHRSDMMLKTLLVKNNCDSLHEYMRKPRKR
jgi:hypothetical protein